MDISLQIMTKELCRRFQQGFVLDPDLFADPTLYRPHIYDQDKCDAYFHRYQALGRVHLAVMKDENPIGEVVLKQIDWEQRFCTMGITMQSDEFKGKGYGTQAEILTLQYAFEKMNMQTVYADTLRNNKRSQHVLEKIGFVETHKDASFVYYRCDKNAWNSLGNSILL